MVRNWESLAHALGHEMSRRLHELSADGDAAAAIEEFLGYPDVGSAMANAQPAAGHTDMTIGIEQFRTPRDLWLDRMLVQPFRGTAGDYPINRDSKEQ